MKLWPIPREIVFVVNLSLIVVISIWGFQLWHYNNQLAEMRADNIEKCFYYDCEVNTFTNQLSCHKKPFIKSIIQNDSVVFDEKR